MRTMSYAKLFRTLAVTAGILSILPACAASSGTGAGTGTGTGASASASARQGPRSSRTLITGDELRSSGATTLYDAIQRLRPQWLANRNAVNRAGSEIVVFQGMNNLGGLDALRQMEPGYIAYVRWLDASEASNTLPGLASRSVAGAIVITNPGNEETR
jgi:ABC-type phosphate transport system substrate-binding protein